MKRLCACLAGLALSSACAGVARADHVFVLSTGIAANDNAVATQLEADGHTVTVGPQYTAYTGGSLTGYSAVVLLQNDTGFGGSIPAAGQTALVNFVHGGGGLLTGEWTNWGSNNGNSNSILQPILPVVPPFFGQYNANPTITYSRATPNTILDSGLPTSFTFAADNNGGTEAYFQPRPGATVFFDSDYGGTPSGNGVIGWSYGAGRVLSLSTLAGPIEVANSQYGTLFSNGVYWVENQAVAEPSTMILLGIGMLAIAAGHRRRALRAQN